jgi:hypothetical protein
VFYKANMSYKQILMPIGFLDRRLEPLVSSKQSLSSAGDSGIPLRIRESDKVTPSRHLCLMGVSFAGLCVGQTDISGDGE